MTKSTLGRLSWRQKPHFRRDTPGKSLPQKGLANPPSESGVTVGSAIKSKYPGADALFPDADEQDVYQADLRTRVRENFKKQQISVRAVLPFGYKPQVLPKPIDVAIGSYPTQLASQEALNRIAEAKRTDQLYQAGQIAKKYRNFRVSIINLEGKSFAMTSHLARGAYGKVHVAMAANGELIAIKSLRSVASKDAGATSRTSRTEAQREAALMQQYYDPAVRLYEDNATQKMYMTMPLALGDLNVVRAIVDCKALVRSAMRQLASQLDIMHRNGAAHLDMKGANVMVAPDGTIKVADMGKAIIAGEQTQPGTTCYTAPEIINQSLPAGTGAQADAWSMGMTLAASYAPLKDSPFDVDIDAQIYGVHLQMQDWRKSMLRSDGAFDTSRLAHDNSEFSEYFRKVYQADPEVCTFVLNHLLTPSEQRATMAEVCVFAQDLQPSASNTEQALQAMLQQQGSGKRIQGLRLALQVRLQDELTSSSVCTAPDQ